MNSAILSLEADVPMLKMQPKKDDHRWDAVLSHDEASDGKFVFAVSSTGVYCRPSCPSKRPRRENVSFFARPQEVKGADFRECLDCRPRVLAGNPRRRQGRRFADSSSST